MIGMGARHIFREAIDILVEHGALSSGHVFITMLQRRLAMQGIVEP